MTNHHIYAMLLAAAAVFSSTPATASASDPEIHVNNFDEPILYRAISDNGRWAVAEVRPNYDGGKVIDLADMSFVTVTNLNNQGFYGRPLDVTDDGEIVVGTYGIEFYEQPAVWRRSTGEWEILDYDASRFGGGHVVAVTPDGHWAVGRVMGRENIFTEATALWDLTTGKMVETPGLPAPQLDTFNQRQNRFTAISPDGRYICAQISPGGSVLYDRDAESYTRPEGVLPDGRKARLSVSTMSPSCRYLFGYATISGTGSSNEDEDVWTNSCIYDMTDGSMQRLRTADVADLMIWGVADDGTLYAGSGGNGTPMRDFQVYAGGYWYALDQILYQAYGIDYYVQTRLSNTGTPYAFSADGRTIASFTDPNRGEGWVMNFNEPFEEICSRVDLMGAYETEPRNGSTMASLGQIRIGFDRNVAIASGNHIVKLLDDNGAEVARALSMSASNNIATIVFRTRSLEPGKSYSVSIPAGTIVMAADPSVATRAITLSYTGRENIPVGLAAEDAGKEFTMRCIDYSANILKLRMNADIKLTDNASARILRAEDRVAVSNLILAASGSELSVKSAATVPLFLHSDYIVEIAAGSFTDPGSTSATANEAIEVVVHGTWEEEPADDTVLFHEDFNNGLGAKFMFYEGDRLEPSTLMKEWGFEAETTPWWVVRDSYYTDDYAACSHSMYNGAGSADDWMVVRRLYIPDEKCRLTFDSQCYLYGRNDVLNVYAIPSDLLFNAITAPCMELFLEKRELIYSELQQPGENTETMEGEWRHNDISLADYAGRYIYIAFVNENTNGSALFVDNVSVVHDMSLSMAVLSPSVVVDRPSQEISIKLYMNSEAIAVENVELDLLDADGALVSSFVSAPGVELSSENPLEVVFPQPLPLTTGEDNYYSIDVRAGEISTRFERCVTSLVFQTTKHVVMEEYSGSQCGNCPDGIIVMEMLKREFGDAFIPMSIRTYMGDELSPVNSDYSSLLGLESMGAPSAAVDRRYGGYPVDVTAGGDIVAFKGSVENGLWYDFVAEQLSTLACADLEASCTPDADGMRLDIPVEVTFAVSRSNADYSLFAVLTEDGVATRQSNYRYQSTDPFYGEWGAGGVYGKAYVYPYYCDDVVRNVSNRNLVGTPGLFPRQISAGESISQELSIDVPSHNVNLDNCRVAVLLVDNATGWIENAVALSARGGSGVADPETGLQILESDGILTVCSDYPVEVTVTDLSGRITAAGEGLCVELPLHKGVAVVSCRGSHGLAVRKFIR